MNNEITEEHTKRIVEEYGKDEWYAVSQMSYPYLVELCLTLRRQMRWASEGRLWEKENALNQLSWLLNRLEEISDWDFVEEILEDYEERREKETTARLIDELKG